MRAVIYARYSTENQREASIADQIRICKERIAHEKWTLVATYTDSAISGSHRLRPGYQRLLHDARNSQFDIVVAEAMDRLSRDQEDIAGLYKHLSFAGVKLLTLSEGDVTELHVGLKGTMNALFLKDLAAKTHRGLRGRVEAGRSGGGLCYGYDVTKEFDATGERIRGGRTINEQEAEIVKGIFKSYAAGASPRAIAIDLNNRKIHGPAGAEWGPSTINGNITRGTGILNNELYIGRLVWNRLRYVKDPLTGKRVSKPNEPVHWIVQEVPELRIVPQELWEDVKARQKLTKRNTRPGANADKPFWERRRPRFLLSGLAKCGQCGSSYVKINANLFGCAAVRDRGTCTNRHNIRIVDLENIVLNGLRERLMDPELFKIFCDEFYKEVNRLRMDESATFNSKKAELEKVERRIQRIVQLITEDDAPARALSQELKVLEERQDQLNSEIEYTEAPKPLIHPGLADVYRRKVTSLQDAINDPEQRDEAFELIRSLIDKVVLTPKDGRLTIDIKGELAGILELCSGAKKKSPGTVSSAGLAKQFKMVAGIGFEPMTFRL